MTALIVKGTQSIKEAIDQIVDNYDLLFNRPEFKGDDAVARMLLAGTDRNLFNLCLYLFLRAKFIDMPPELLIKHNSVVVVHDDKIYSPYSSEEGQPVSDIYTSTISFADYYMRTITTDCLNSRRGISMYERGLGIPMNTLRGLPITGKPNFARSEESRRKTSETMGAQDEAKRRRQAATRGVGKVTRAYTPVAVQGKTYATISEAMAAIGLSRSAAYRRCDDVHDDSWMWADVIHNPKTRKALSELSLMNAL